MDDKNNLIHIIMTGGTIDSVWDPGQDTVTVAEHSQIPDYFASKKVEIRFSESCMKDSRALTEEDLTEILKTVEDSKEKKIIITHGIFAMPDTAKFLQDNLKRKDLFIILTGSKTPIGFTGSDAPANLDFAMKKLTELQPGIYLCLNQQILTIKEAEKSLSEGNFYQ